MPTKGVLDRQRIGETIIATARTHAQEVGENLQRIVGPFLPEGETLPDVVQLQLQLAGYLESRLAESVAADNAHLVELRDDDDPRRRRDDAAAEVYRVLVGIREAVIGGFGENRVGELLAYDGATPTDPLILHRTASLALERLRGRAATPPSRLPGVVVELDRLADELQPALDGLSGALSELARERKLAERTLRRRDLSLDAVDAGIAGIGRILIGCHELAGLREYRDKIRLTRSARRRRDPAEDESPSLPTTEEPSEPEPEVSAES